MAKEGRPSLLKRRCLPKSGMLALTRLVVAVCRYGVGKFRSIIFVATEKPLTIPEPWMRHPVTPKIREQVF
ncbi:hypothetical protein BJP08_03935 [Corynebacterium sp. NML140438]|nr:hypothetical protein BJP08_03935 [Corynebacterium sp. NML140438]